MDDMDTKEITSMGDLLKIFGIDESKIQESGFKVEKGAQNKELNPGCKFTHNNETYKLMFKWINGIYFGSDQPDPLAVSKVKSEQAAPARGFESMSMGNNLMVPHSVSNPVGLMRPTTFREQKDKLLLPEESPLSPSISKMHQEELRLRAEAIVDSLKEHKIKSRRIHLVFMFASPLVIFFQNKDGKGFGEQKAQSLMKLDFRREFNEIENVLMTTKTMTNYYKICANLDNLTSVLLRNPKVLHFSGHGVKNSTKEIGSTAALKAGEGDLLVFEDKKGCADLVSERMLKDILKKCKNEIELVFVSS